MVRSRPNPSGSARHPQITASRALKFLSPFLESGESRWAGARPLISSCWVRQSDGILLLFSCSRRLPLRERITSTTHRNGARRRYGSLIICESSPGLFIFLRFGVL
jgi:hypothetical protein